MLKKSVLLKIFILTLSFTLTQGFSQNISTPSPGKNLWASLNMGFFKGSESSGLLGILAIDYLNNDYIFSLEYFGGGTISKSLTFSQNDEKTLEGISILVGGVKRRPLFKLSYSLGLSLIETYNSYADTDTDVRADGFEFSIGLPLSSQLVFTPTRIVAIGIKAYANINSQNSIAGLGIGLYFGKVD